MLLDFFFCSHIPVEQTASGIGYRVKNSFFGLATNTLNVRNNNDIARGDHTHWACLFLPCVIFHYSSSTSR